MAVWGYIRVSTIEQNAENQKIAILEYASNQKMAVDHWVELTMSSRKSAKERKIDELLKNINDEDVLLVAELSRLGRSVGQIAITVKELLKKRINLICLKENIQLNGKANIQSKVMITMFSLFAEIERDLISERTKEGLARAKAEGRLVGRPKGTLGKSKLDGKEKEIKDFLKKGVNKANVARYFGVSWPTLDNFIRTRGLQKISTVLPVSPF